MSTTIENLKVLSDKEKEEYVKSIKDYVKEIMVDKENTEKDLEEYLNPLSSKHKEYIGSIYRVNYDENNRWPYTFARFISSWQNGTGKGFIKEKEMAEDIERLVCGFDLEDFFKKYGDTDCMLLFQELTNVNGKYNSIINNEKTKIRRRTDQMYFCEGIYSIAQLLSKIKEDELTTFEELYTNDNVNQLVGMSWTLYSDAIKESSLIDVAKSDIHIQSILSECYFDNYNNKIPQSEKQMKDFYYKFKELADALNIGLYELDKLFWLASTGNFYFDNISKNKIKGNNLRQKFIEFVNKQNKLKSC